MLWREDEDIEVPTIHLDNPDFNDFLDQSVRQNAW
jgi:hypothetical protein